MSRAAALRDEYGRRRGQNPKPPPLGQRRVARRRARARAEWPRRGRRVLAVPFGDTRGEQGFTPERFRDERGDRGVPRGRPRAGTRGRSPAAAPRPDDAFGGTEGVSARNRVFPGFSPPATSEGSDIYTSSLDRTTARTSSRGTSSATSSRRGALARRAREPSRRKPRRWRAPPSPTTRLFRADASPTATAPAERTSPARARSGQRLRGARQGTRGKTPL